MLSVAGDSRRMLCTVFTATGCSSGPLGASCCSRVPRGGQGGATNPAGHGGNRSQRIHQLLQQLLCNLENSNLERETL